MFVLHTLLNCHSVLNMSLIVVLQSESTCPMATLLNTVLLPIPIYSPEKSLSAAFTASISSVLPQVSVIVFLSLVCSSTSLCRAVSLVHGLISLKLYRMNVYVECCKVL